MKNMACKNHRKIWCSGAAILAAVIAAYGLTDARAQENIDTAETVDGDHPEACTKKSPWNVNAELSVGHSGTGSLTISGRGVVSNTGKGFIGRNQTGKGTVTVTGGGSTWTNNSELHIGNSGSGELMISNGGSVSSAGAGYIGVASGSSGAVEVTGKYSKWHSAAINAQPFYGSLYVGHSGAGKLKVSDGGSVSGDGEGFIGREPNGNGEVEVSGSGSKWSSRRELYVGYEGTGALTISDGGDVSNTETNAGAGYIGYKPKSAGVVEVGRSSKWTNNGSLDVGHEGTGTLKISGGGSVSNTGTGRIGTRSNSKGTVEVAGKNSTWSLTRNPVGNFPPLLLVGVFGTGELTISGGGTVSNGAGAIGHENGKGMVMVTGEGSQWINSDAIYVGHWGVGELTISSGGTVSNTGEGGYIGQKPGTNGKVVVTGEGSKWINGNNLRVGSEGAGQLTISNGGVVSNNDYAVIALDPGSKGSVEVTGNGSEWTSNGRLYVGYEDTGELTISSGGTVVADVIAIAWDANSSGTINIGAEAGAAATAPGMLNVTSTTGVSFRSGTGTLVFNHTDDNYTFSTPISGTNTASKLNALAGVTTLSSANTYSGTTTVSEGTLKAGVANTGTAGAFSPNSGFIVESAGILDANGLNQTVASLSNGGQIMVGSPAGTGGTTLTVTGNYTGSNGSLVLNTNLGGDSSLTDQVIINSTGVSGTTEIVVNKVGSSSGGQTTNGIALVRVAGGAGNNALDSAFTLSGSPLIAGNYEYTLSAVDDNGDKLFVLKSGPRSGGVGATAIPALPLPLLLILTAAVGLLGRRRLHT